MKKRFWFILSIFAVLASCGGVDDSATEERGTQQFDRSAILVNWADNIIVPAYADYTLKTASLKASAGSFATTKDETSLIALRADFVAAYAAWQQVSMFEIGPAENIQLRNFTNIYPTDVSAINTNISSGTYNFQLPSSIDEQGFPALDYLLYGTGSTDSEILSYFNNTPAAIDYLLAVTDRLNILGQQVLTSWNNTFRNEYVANDGDAVNASFNKTVNAYIEYYERNLRSGKVGIPAGALSGTPSSSRVEAFYAKELSRSLFLEALGASEAFYRGDHFNSSNSGAGLFDALNTLDKQSLANDINSQFGVIRQKAQSLNANFALQVQNNNTAMLELRDELQINTILMKNDMVSALNVTIAYVDNDGD